MMFSSFFALAALSPTRQRTFRRAVVVHLLLLTAAAWPLVRQGPHGSPALLGHLLLIAGIIEGAALVGWRLAQMPKSQALEFLLVSPLRPHWLFVHEAVRRPGAAGPGRRWPGCRCWRCWSPSACSIRSTPFRSWSCRSPGGRSSAWG